MIDLFLSYMQLLNSQTLTNMLWSYLYIIVMFLSAVWTLILMAPIYCRESIDEQVTAILQWIVLGESKYLHN